MAGKVVRTTKLEANDFGRFTPMEHIYKIPDTYVGSDGQIPREDWLYDFEQKRMIRATITLPQAVERLFLEIISNSGDNADRSRRCGVDPGKIEVLMNRRVISVRNGGVCIPVEMNTKENMWAPELIFGVLLTSSNYNQEKEIRMGCGRNGYGAKLVNVFSKSFMVRVGDADRHLLYTQVWNANMTVCQPPTIVPYTESDSFVEVTYEMDFERFKYQDYPDEAFNLFARFTLDFSFTCKVPVSFNGIEFDYRNVREYSSLYFGELTIENSLVHYEWAPGVETYQQTRKEGGACVAKDPKEVPIVELCLIDTPDAGSVISFVNGIMTIDGGVHVDAVQKAVSSSLLETINVRDKGESKSKAKTKGKGKGKASPKAKTEPAVVKLTLADVKPHISLILSCRLPDPKYKSQTKTSLAEPKPDLTIDDTTLAPVMRWSLIDRLLATLEAKQLKKINGTDSKRRRHIKTKGEDANEAGGPRSLECMLMIVEGRSAMGYAYTFQSLTPGGRDMVGIMPLKGKPLNIYNVDRMTIHKNKEVQELRLMLGLKDGVDYSNPANLATLRYGYILIAADQDTDGSHIKALMMLFFGHLYPSLVKLGRLMYLNTPRLRVFKGKETLTFYSKSEYEQWTQVTPDFKKYKHKYYKGLGTSKKEDIKEDFKDPHYVTCQYDENTPRALRLAFDKTLTDTRKEWISQWNGHVDGTTERVQLISDFICHELIEYSLDNLTRAIPKLLDGLKESQRKIIWATFSKWASDSKHNILQTQPNEIKVERFAQFVGDYTAYHHGGRILEDVIVSMAQNFVGANNLPYFQRDGQFGTRNQGGKDCAEARYAETRPEWWLNYAFKKEDLPLLEQLVDEGKKVEPVTLLPILPLQLINGASGVATGWSTFIPNHDVIAVCEWLKGRINGVTDLPAIIPNYYGFTGGMEIKSTTRRVMETLKKADEESSEESGREETDEVIEKLSSRKSLISTGIYKQISPLQVEVTELPVGMWTKKYKELLEKDLDEKIISDYVDKSTDETVYFLIKGVREATLDKLHLTRAYGLTNMVLLGIDNRPIRYPSSEAILEAFYQARLPYYEARKQNIIDTISRDIDENVYRITFVAEVLKGNLHIMGQKKEVVVAQMEKLGIPKELYPKMRATHFSKDEIEELQADIMKLSKERQIMMETRASDLWVRDIEAFEMEYCKRTKTPLPASFRTLTLTI